MMYIHQFLAPNLNETASHDKKERGEGGAEEINWENTL